ncbi:DUF935 family protein, partial [Glaesserella parasuis]
STVNFAEHHHHETEMDRIVSQMGELSQHSLNANIAQVRARLDTAESLEEAQQILDDILPQLDFSEYAQLFAEGLTTATLRGRYEVKQEAKR